jgi:hypothetical protein
VPSLEGSRPSSSCLIEELKLHTIPTLNGLSGDQDGKECVMSGITVESIFNQIIQLPPSERIKLWQLLEKFGVWMKFWRRTSKSNGLES